MFWWKSSHSMQVGGQMTELAVAFHITLLTHQKT